MREGTVRPRLEARVFVWLALAVVFIADLAFVWLFVLGHGFDFTF